MTLLSVNVSGVTRTTHTNGQTSPINIEPCCMGKKKLHRITLATLSLALISDCFLLKL